MLSTNKKPPDVFQYLEKAETLVKEKQFDQALLVLNQSLQIKETVSANKWIAQILMINGRVEEALFYLEKASKMMPDDPTLIYNLGGAYVMNAQYEKAQEILNQLDQIDPDFPDFLDIRKRLKDKLANRT